MLSIRSPGKRATHFWICRSFTNSQESGILKTGACPEVRRTGFAFNRVNAYDAESNLIFSNPASGFKYPVSSISVP